MVKREDLDSKDVEIFRNYRLILNKIKSFSNNVTSFTFDKLFGDDSKRLWKHYTEDCKRDFNKFETYLDTKQLEHLLVNVYKNENLYL